MVSQLNHVRNYFIVELNQLPRHFGKMRISIHFYFSGSMMFRNLPSKVQGITIFSDLGVTIYVTLHSACLMNKE